MHGASFTLKDLLILLNIKVFKKGRKKMILCHVRVSMCSIKDSIPRWDLDMVNGFAVLNVIEHFRCIIW